MFSKKTDKLLDLLKNTESINDYLEDNNNQFLNIEFIPLLNELLTIKGITKYNLFKNSHLDINYGYQIFNGSRKPNRDKIIQLAFGLNSDLDMTQLLLKTAHESPLYVRNKRDSIIIFGLNNQLSLLDVEEILIEYGEKLIIN